MSVIRRNFRSTPHRDSLETWTAIVDLLTKGSNSDARTALMGVAGVAASTIADQAPRDSAIVVTCSGPRTRVYCLYDEDAIDGSDANEDPLGYDPLDGDWHVSLPCLSDDLEWVQRALEKHGSRVTARDAAESLGASVQAESSKSAFELDVKGFLGS